LIEVEAREWVDLARYSWARDLLLPVGSIREHALAEADAAGHPGSNGAPEAALNFLLLLSAAEQVTADYLARGGLDLSPLRKAMRGKRIAAAALSGLETVAEHLCSIRASIGERGIARQLEDLRGLALEVATAIAGGEPRVAIDPSDVARRFPPPESALTGCRMKVPSCFRAQDLNPLDCFELARRFALTVPTGSEVLVVGIRTSGSYMAPLVAGWLRSRGFAARYTTLRPKAPLVRLEADVIRRHGARSVLIVDDPPMTGASYLRTAQRLRQCGVGRRSITFLVPVGAENALDAGGLAPEFDRYNRVELRHQELEIRRQLPSPELLAYLASALGHPGAQVTPVLPADEVERQARRRHVKQVYEVEGAGRVHVKGVGVGWFGYPARHAASALSGRIPEVVGFWGTLMVTREVTVGPTAGPRGSDVAAYVATRAQALRLPARRTSEKFEKDAFYRLAKLMARVHGPLAPLRMARLRRELARAAGEGPACLIDGRMGRDEWLEGSPALKRDFEEHAFDKDDLGLHDPAYDLAGALLELGPNRAFEESLVSSYVALSGDLKVRSRLTLALLLYGAFLLERRSWEVKGELGTSAWPGAVQAWLEAEAVLTWSVNRLLGDAFPVRRAEHDGVLWSIDVDGVLEDAGLGFPAATPAAALALQRAHEAGALVVLNSGRSLPELVLRCDALRLDGAVAEYGSAIWDAMSGLSQSLLDDDDREALALVRLAANRLRGVHLDSRYRYSVRARRFVNGKLRALAAEQIQTLLEAGGDRVRIIQGVGQTDFISAAHDKGSGLDRLRARLHFRGGVLTVGDAEPDVPVAVRATRAYAPRYGDVSLVRAAVHLRADRQMAVLEAVRREHGSSCGKPQQDLPAADSALVRLLALRDASRPVRALRAFGPGLLEVFRT
jgi:hydroxymethylpyrimidine pyrophosphatase-like HAD family hydrolase